ncbi:hypothetical protein L1987_61923 [Smallanthus sonchifolius]|uniref:Uncharacterized protein n=1 Tax=Smallanthus sonchifolius TaxID=185202 RepID=A0ACB9C904_9ASTR|nr:hypothetical protein L1987_61923 [Smallanthus sonchifolius]
MASNAHTSSSSCSGQKVEASDESYILFLKMLLDAIAKERDSSTDVENLSNEIQRLNKTHMKWKVKEITYYLSLLEFVSSFLKDTENPNESSSSSSSPGDQGSLKSLFKELCKMRAAFYLLAITLNKILYEGELRDTVERLSTIHNEIEDRSRVMIIKKQQDDDDDDDVEKPESSSSTLLEGVVNYQSENLRKIIKQFLEEIVNKDDQDGKNYEGEENPTESFPVVEHSENDDMQEARNEDPPQDVENLANNQNGIIDQQDRNQNPLDLNENPANNQNGIDQQDRNQNPLDLNENPANNQNGIDQQDRNQNPLDLNENPANNQNGIDQQDRNQNPLDLNENPAEWPTVREGLIVKKGKKKKTQRL